MLHAAKRTAQHYVSEVFRALKLGDANHERLPDSEMSRSPSHLLVRADEAGCDACNGALASAQSRVGVKFDAASQVEHALNRSCDGSGEFNDGHCCIFTTAQAFSLSM